ncbi:MAG: Nramp family divalent metal transporter [Verrucomicrobiales bacterium]|nr:Nramp family divalent metal transporter [Verrucomicrobiales bacterium]
MLNRLRQIGPAIVVAAVVLGPGSITTSTKVGAAFGYDMLWLMVVLLALLIGVASLASWLGATLEHSLCTELSNRLGKWAGWIIGISFFLIVAGFQSSNNMAVIAGIEPLIGTGSKLPAVVVVAVLLAVNALIIGILYLAKDLYKQVEKIMKVMVLLMIAAFVVNLFFAKPSLSGIFGGLVPDFSAFQNSEQLLILMGLIATTFSVAGAFYQGYLVREKGWGPDKVKAGFFDSFLGMCVLVGVTSVVMMTSAATFYGKVTPAELSDAGKMSGQLREAFGSAASWIFCFGFLAGAFSSFLVNAMIGGHVFSDGIGLGSSLQDKGTRHLTTSALLVGMCIGIASLVGGFDRTTTIVIAQASTVVGGPAVVAGLLYLGWRQFLKESNKPPLWALILTSLAMIVTLSVAATTGKSVVAKIENTSAG